MKTTLNIDDALYRRAKVQAAEEGLTVSELIEEGLELVLTARSRPATVLRRPPLPLIEGGHPALPDREASPERTAEILLNQEATWAQENR